MALQGTLSTPDKVETSADVQTFPRSRWDKVDGVWTPTALGNYIKSETTTTTTFTAATKAACDTYKAAYTGEGAITITQENKVVNSWSLVLVERTTAYTWEPVEEEE